MKKQSKKGKKNKFSSSPSVGKNNLHRRYFLISLFLIYQFSILLGLIPKLGLNLEYVDFDCKELNDETRLTSSLLYILTNIDIELIYKQYQSPIYNDKPFLTLSLDLRRALRKASWYSLDRWSEETDSRTPTLTIIINGKKQIKPLPVREDKNFNLFIVIQGVISQNTKLSSNQFSLLLDDTTEDNVNSIASPEDTVVYSMVKALFHAIKESIKSLFEMWFGYQVNHFQVDSFNVFQKLLEIILVIAALLQVTTNLIIGNLIVTFSVKKFIARVYEDLVVKVHSRLAWRHNFFSSVATLY